MVRIALNLSLQFAPHEEHMTERIKPYWVGNIARIDFSQKGFQLGPDSVAPAYGQIPPQPPSAKVIPFTSSKKK